MNVTEHGSRTDQSPGTDMAFVVALTAVLAAWNNGANLVPAFDQYYVVVNLAASLALLVWARRAGLSWPDIGLARDRTGHGLRWGALAFALVAVGLLGVLAMPETRPVLIDGRIAHLSGAQVAFLSLVRIPLGTVVLEELAFRGVLFGAVERWRGRTAAVAWSSVLFGLWHITPTLHLLDANGVADDPLTRTGAVAASVAATTAAGVVLCLLRIASGSLLAPVLAHVGSNSVAAVTSFVATQAD